MDTGVFRRRSSAALTFALAAALLIPAAVLGQPEPEQATSVENKPTDMLGSEPTLFAENTLVTRHEDRLVFEVTMDTPSPGTYNYPADVEDERKAPPEVFTGWVFVFNHPENCTGEGTCGAEDFSDEVQAGVYGAAGHVTSIDHEGGSFILDRATDGTFTLRGEIVVGDPQRPNLPPEEESTYALSNPLGAEIHFAIAPHGQVDPATMAEELYGPVGNPGCGCWWLAMFQPHGEDG